MERNSENAIIVTIPNPPQNDEPKPAPIRTQKRKNGGPMHVLKVALFMMRGRSKKTSVLPVEDDRSKNVWRKLVGSMRPLHLQSNQSPRSISLPNHTLPPSSPSESIGGCSAYTAEEEPYSPSPVSSRYASAVGLNELVQSDEEIEKQDAITEECNEQNEDDGDEKIDAKADEFIAQFYRQMRLQRLNKVDRHYHERSQRSLGW